MSSPHNTHIPTTSQPNTNNTQNCDTFQVNTPQPAPLHPLTLSICTHNVQGLKTNTKKEAWEHYCLQQDLDIVCISETKLSDKTITQKRLKTQHYTYLWSCTNSSKAGTAIMVRNTLTPHIHSVHTVPGYAIAIDLFFKHDFKFRIISLYLPSNDAQLRLQTQNTIIQWLQQAKVSNIYPIVLGDFNASADNIHTQSIKLKLLQYLAYNNMYDLASHSNKST